MRFFMSITAFACYFHCNLLFLHRTFMINYYIYVISMSPNTFTCCFSFQLTVFASNFQDIYTFFRVNYCIFLSFLLQLSVFALYCNPKGCPNLYVATHGCILCILCESNVTTCTLQVNQTDNSYHAG